MIPGGQPVLRGAQKVTWIEEATRDACGILSDRRWMAVHHTRQARARHQAGWYQHSQTLLTIGENSFGEYFASVGDVLGRCQVQGGARDQGVEVKGGPDLTPENWST